MRGSQHRRARGWLWLCLIVIATTVIGSVLWGMVWWEERPLRATANLLEQNDGTGALRSVDRFLRDHPDHSQGIALKARALVQLGRSSEAIRLFEKVGAASTDDMRAYTKACLMLEQWVQASPVLEYLLRLDPDDADLLHEVAACRAKLGEVEGAVDAASRFASIAGNEARGYLLVGILERDRGNLRKACDAWARVFQVNPDAIDLQISADGFHLEYGKALLKLGEPAAAMDRLKQSIAIKPSSTAISLLGKAFSQLGKEEDAEQEWRKALELDPSNETARQGLAELAMKKSDFQGAMDWLQPLAGSPELSSATAFLLQRVSSLLGDTESASAWQARVEQIRKLEELHGTVDQVLNDSPDSMWGQVLQAYRLAEQGNWDQAELLLKPFLEDPAHPFISALGAAVQARSALPQLSGLPIESF